MQKNTKQKQQKKKKKETQNATTLPEVNMNSFISFNLRSKKNFISMINVLIDHTRHFSNWCDICKVVKLVHRNQSALYTTTTTRALLADS